MDYRTQYRSFINSHYLSEGVRITFGLTLPAIVFSYFNQQSIGITLSLGASCVILVDNPGPIHHRRNAMLICDLAIFVVALLTGLAAASAVTTGLLIALICFAFTMIGVYGARASSLGLAALFIMVLNLDKSFTGWHVFTNAFYVFCGGLWYTILSLLLNSFRPYKLTQQALGDCIQASADFLLAKAAFYEKGVDFDLAYRKLLEQQILAHDKQDLVRELLFKSRSIVRESTNTGRVLLLIFLDVIDLFERVMSSHQNYPALHAWFDNSNILTEIRDALGNIAFELNETGIAVKSGKRYTGNQRVNESLKKLRDHFEALRDRERNASNVDGFISLRNILDGMKDIAERLYTLQQYTSYDLSFKKDVERKIEYDRFVTHQDIDAKLLFDNLNLQSNTFRHALRVTIATTAGFIVSQFFPFGHGYWIMLTIIVILKPAYSITKKRNYDRLLGTIAGAMIGLLIIYFVKNRDLMLTCMIVLMVIAYSFMRTRYLLFVTMMTPYILILFHLLNPHEFRSLITDRVTDTIIGSGIAFLANIFIVPAWEHEHFADYLLTMLEANKNYFLDVARSFTGELISIMQYKLSRKQAYVALANLSEAFNRLLSEPRHRQRKPETVHQLVVLNHMLASHTATLASIVRDGESLVPDNDYKPVILYVASKLDYAKALLAQQPFTEEPVSKEALRKINDRVNEMIELRKSELDKGIADSHTRTLLASFKPTTDQFNFILKISEDMEKVVAQWIAKEPETA